MNGDGDGTRLRQLRWALNGNGLVVLTRPVSAAPGGQLVRHRLTVHIVGDAGELLDEREFMPTAQRFGLALEVDRQVVRQAVGIAARGCAVQIGLAVETLADPDLLALVDLKASNTVVSSTGVVMATYAPAGDAKTGHVDEIDSGSFSLDKPSDLELKRRDRMKREG